MDFKIKISTILFAAFTALAVALPAESFGQDGRGLMPGVEGDEREEDEHDGLVKEVGLCDLGPDGEWVVPERGGFGPLDLWSNSPFQSLRLGIIPRPPSILNRGKYQVRFSSTYVNVWAIEENAYFLDYDNVRSTLSFSYSVMDDLQMEMGFSDIHAFGGDMDSFIEGFHDIFGIDQDSRDEYPQNDFRVEILDDFGNGLVDLKDFREVRRQSVHAIIQKDLNGCATRLPIFSLALIGRWHFSQPEGTPDFGYADAGLSLSMATRYRGYITTWL